MHRKNTWKFWFITFSHEEEYDVYCFVPKDGKCCEPKDSPKTKSIHVQKGFDMLDNMTDNLNPVKTVNDLERK